PQVMKKEATEQSRPAVQSSSRAETSTVPPREARPAPASEPVEIRAAPVPQAPARAIPGPAADRRRAQISIGRIDVQVNNPPPDASPNPPPAGGPPVYPHF